MKRYELAQSEVAKAPWVDGCRICAALSSTPEPGLFTYILAVANHFDNAHGIALVNPG